MVEIENPKDVSNRDDSDSENLRIDEVGDGDKECVLSDDMEPVQKLCSFQPFKLRETFPQVSNARAVTRCTSDKPVLQRKITCETPLRREKQKIQLTLKACVALFLKAKAVHADRCIQVLSNEEFWEFVAAILDSGATFDIGSLPIHGPYAKKIRKLAEPVYVTTASGANIAIEHVGTFEVRVNRPKGIYRFGSLEVYLVNSNDWQEMLIGESTLRAHGLMPDQTIDRILEVQQKYEVPISARSFNARMAKEVFGLKLGGSVEEDGDDEDALPEFRAEGSQKLNELNERLSRTSSASWNVTDDEDAADDDDESCGLTFGEKSAKLKFDTSEDEVSERSD